MVIDTRDGSGGFRCAPGVGFEGWASADSSDNSDLDQIQGSKFRAGKIDDGALCSSRVSVTLSSPNAGIVERISVTPASRLRRAFAYLPTGHRYLGSVLAAAALVCGIGLTASAATALSAAALTPDTTATRHDSATDISALPAGSAWLPDAPGSPAAPTPAPIATKAPSLAGALSLPANIAPHPGYDSSCQSAPRGPACQQAAIAALDHGRVTIGLAPYALPAGFESMSVPQQLLILTNLDRSAYGLEPVAGLNATVTAAAQTGVTTGTDPDGVDIGGSRWSAWGSNWAAGYASALFTYYYWMYDDGSDSGNISCTTADTSGCWGHRMNTLHDFGPGVQIVMGVGQGPNGGTAYAGLPAFTELYESFSAGDALS